MTMMLITIIIVINVIVHIHVVVLVMGLNYIHYTIMIIMVYLVLVTWLLVHVYDKIEAVLKELEENVDYRKIPRRAYSRRSLFLEVQEFLNHEFGIQMLNATDARYREFMRGIIQDTGEGYKRLRIEKKI